MIDVDIESERIYEEILLEEARMEFLKDSPILRFFDVAVFMSRSKGRKRKRKFFSWVILLKPKQKNEWILFREDGCLNGRKYLFDKWATEIFGEEFCGCLSENPGEYLKEQLLPLLDKLKRF